MPIKAVLFDIDGTLVDSNDLHVRAWQQAFGESGLEAAPDAIREQIGKGADNLVPTLFPDLDEARQKALGGAHGRVFKQVFLDRVQPFAGARDLMARVHEAGQQVVLASSASREELDHYIDLFDARDIVDATTSIDDVATSKPAPDIFAAALKKTGLAPDQAVVLGDTPYDMQAAAKCGMPRIAVRSGGFADDVLRAAGADTIYDDVAALLAGFDTSPLAPGGDA